MSSRSSTTCRWSALPRRERRPPEDPGLGRQLPRQLSGDTSQISNAAETVTTALLGAMGMALIMIALLIDGPWLVAGAQRLIPPERRDTADRMGRIVGRVIGRYFAGSLLLSVLQGLQVLVTGLVLGVPLSPLLAVWAAVWNLGPAAGRRHRRHRVRARRVHPGRHDRHHRRGHLHGVPDLRRTTCCCR